jgi:hypothetical protein
MVKDLSLQCLYAFHRFACQRGWHGRLAQVAPACSGGNDALREPSGAAVLIEGVSAAAGTRDILGSVQCGVGAVYGYPRTSGTGSSRRGGEPFSLGSRSSRLPARPSDQAVASDICRPARCRVEQQSECRRHRAAHACSASARVQCQRTRAQKGKGLLSSLVDETSPLPFLRETAQASCAFGIKTRISVPNPGRDMYSSVPAI